MAREFLLDMKNAQKSLWTEAINTACHIGNRLDTRSCNEDKTPYEVINGKQSFVRLFKIIGLRAYVHIPAKIRKDKLEASSKSGVLVGYSKECVYRILMDETNKIVKTKDVTFLETGMVKPN